TRDDPPPTQQEIADWLLQQRLEATQVQYQQLVVEEDEAHASDLGSSTASQPPRPPASRPHQCQHLQQIGATCSCTTIAAHPSDWLLHHCVLCELAHLGRRMARLKHFFTFLCFGVREFCCVWRGWDLGKACYFFGLLWTFLCQTLVGDGKKLLWERGGPVVGE
ncbi:hypothetical protein NDU88_012076, partial [Pleurodeles waltl]